MTNAELYLWMADSSLLNKSSLQELKQMVDDFPYFHAVRILYLKNLAVLDDIRLDKELKKMSIYIPDRKRLFILINDRLIAGNDDVEQKPHVEEVKKSGDTIDIALANSSPTQVSSVLTTSDYANWLDSNMKDLPAIRIGKPVETSGPDRFLYK